MAELGQLKKRLRGVELSGQLAGAVKTAASAKLSILNRLYSSYRTYTEELESIVSPLLAHAEDSPAADGKAVSMHSSSSLGSFTFGGPPSGSSPLGGSPYGSSTVDSSPLGGSSSDSFTLGSSPSGSSPSGGSPSDSSPLGSSPFGDSPFGSSHPSETLISSPFERDDGDSDGQLKPCYIIIGHNKGLCGSFNSELHSYADEYIAKHGNGKLYVCGKCAIAYFEGKTALDGAFVLSDIPKAEQCKPLFEQLINALMFERSSVTIIYQQFINTLTQTPAVKILNPPAKRNFNIKGRKNTEVNDILCVPDRITVTTAIQRKFYETVLHKIILESALSAQSATLTAMRTAYDNAVETAETLENEINKTRQRAVTTGVLETASGMASEWEEEENGIRK